MPQRIYLVRHADAVPGGPGTPDDVRHLAAAGRARARAVGARLAEEGVAVDAVLASPLVRAVQTAELIVGALGYGGEVAISEHLVPGGSVGRAADDVLAAGGAVAAVGHEPSISALAAHLAGRAVAGFRLAQVVLVEDGRLVWRLDPHLLRVERAR